MPGRVVEGHAEFESDCSSCHVDDSRPDIGVNELCAGCHEGVGEDRRTGRGFHGRSNAARRSDCVACHTDHEGRDADIVPEDYFSHDLADFALTGAHASISCSGCHETDVPPRDATSTCIGCHDADDPHEGQLGAQCANCHSDDAWDNVQFDHASVGYALTGGHAEVACTDCHGGNQFASTPTSCSSCHAVDDVHVGSNGNNCSSCHSVATWRNLSFNHAAETGFALVDGHGGLDCLDCHTRDDYRDDLSSDCASCHLPDDDHQGRNGDQCASCHRPTHWPDSLFDHAESGYPLRAAHADLNCAACHKTSVEDTLPTDCGGCHALDDVHLGQLGSSCGSCHSEATWAESIAFDHDLSGFPLTGIHAAVSCEGCHQSERFHDASTECVDCHGDDDVHGGSLGADCGACHTSNAWPVASFHHGDLTGFPLDGGHAGLTCSSCHGPSEEGIGAAPSSCGGCHQADDVHNGQFGSQCERCHSTSTFNDVGRLQ